MKELTIKDGNFEWRETKIEPVISALYFYDSIHTKIEMFSIDWDYKNEIKKEDLVNQIKIDFPFCISIKDAIASLQNQGKEIEYFTTEMLEEWNKYSYNYRGFFHHRHCEKFNALQLILMIKAEDQQPIDGDVVICKKNGHITRQVARISEIGGQTTVCLFPYNGMSAGFSREGSIITSISGGPFIPIERGVLTKTGVTKGWFWDFFDYPRAHTGINFPVTVKLWEFDSQEVY